MELLIVLVVGLFGFVAYLVTPSETVRLAELKAKQERQQRERELWFDVGRKAGKSRPTNRRARRRSKKKGR